MFSPARRLFRLLVGLVFLITACLISSFQPKSSESPQFLKKPISLSGDFIWSPTIREWQERSERHGRRMAEIKETDLGREYREFTRGLYFSLAHLSLATEVMAFVQGLAQKYYLADKESAYRSDHWPSLPEILDTGEDDCDGFALLIFSALRQLGFAHGEIYLGLMFDKEADLYPYHAVSFYFPQGEGKIDPYMLDSTGLLSKIPVRISKIPENWEAAVIFDERKIFTLPKVRTSN